MTGNDDGLKVFISYSRKDSGFADELLAGLELLGFAAFLDKHDIAAGEDWERRLSRLIEAADTVVFVISPDSIGSERCAWEVKRTGEAGKRLLPIVWRTVEEANVPPDLKRLNYIYFDKPHVFAAGLKALSTALRTDLDWVREHTRIGDMASRWQERKRNEALLMRGEELVAAKAWGARQPRFAPEPTLLMREFLAAGESAERERVAHEDALKAAAQDAEVKRVKAEQEVAEARLDSQQRRSRYLLAGSGIALLLVGGIGWQAWQLSQTKLERERDRLRIAELERIAAQQQVARAAQELDRVTAGQPASAAGGAGGGRLSGSQPDRTAPATPPGADARPAAAPPIGNDDPSRSGSRGPAIAASPPGPAPLTPEQARRMISDDAYRTMIDYDTGGRRYYEDALKGAPTWPGYSSGVTVGLGYDLGYVSEEKLVADWGKHLSGDQIGRLKTAVGITGSEAQPLARQLADIRIPWEIAEKVFQDMTVTQFVNMTDRALANFRALAPDAAGALVSLVLNRGADFRSTSDKRLEMRNIREHMEKKEFTKIPAELRAMKRHWTSKGLQDRREAEAVLFERGLVAMSLLDRPSGPLPAVNAPQTATR